MEHYDYLDYDYVIFYSGYNDSNPNELNKASARHYNTFFKLFGIPILDTYIYEKFILIFYGDLEKFMQKLNQKVSVSFSLDKENKPVRKENKINQSAQSTLADNNKTPFKEYIDEYENIQISLNNEKKLYSYINQS